MVSPHECVVGKTDQRRGICQLRTLKLPISRGSNWPPLTAERSAPFDRNAIHCRRSRHGRLLYVAMQLMTAGTWPALDDPQRTSKCCD